MQLSSGTDIPDGFLAAMTPLKEKPRPGVPSCNPAPHPGRNVLQSTAALGLGWSAASGTRQSEQIGRFISPDWSDDPEPVPYADLSNPQSLNLYSLGFNNPLTNTDADGHDCDQSTTVVTTTIFGVADGSRVTDNQRAPCNPTGIVTDAVSNVANNASQAIQNAAHQMWNYLNAPRDKGCLLKSAAKGAGYGAGTGAVLGGLGGAGVGLATTAGGASIPLALGGAAEGASVGGQLGLSVGTGIGFLKCTTGGVGSSGGGSGGGKQGKFWKSLKSFRKGIKTDGQRLYEWDYTHGDVEVYNYRGQHLGSADPDTGQMIKPAVPGRTITL